MIMNLINPDSGNVSLFGMNYSTDAKRIKERIGFVYDDNVFYDELTLKEITKIIAPAYKNGILTNLHIIKICRITIK